MLSLGSQRVRSENVVVAGRVVVFDVGKREGRPRLTRCFRDGRATIIAFSAFMRNIAEAPI